MADLRSKRITLGGRDWQLKLSVSSFRYAQALGKGITDEELQKQAMMTLAPRLVFIALLPQDDGLTEEQVLRWLVESDEEEEILSFVTRQFFAATQVLGKSLPSRVPSGAAEKKAHGSTSTTSTG